MAGANHGLRIDRNVEDRRDVSQTFRCAGGTWHLTPFRFPEVDEQSHWESVWTGRDASSASWYQSTAAT